MSYEAFVAMVNALIIRKNLDIKPRFYHDIDEGKYYACCDDVDIIGTPKGKKVTVKWGSSHMSMAAISEVKHRVV